MYTPGKMLPPRWAASVDGPDATILVNECNRLFTTTIPFAYHGNDGNHLCANAS
jgi:hypothetical protein